MSNPQTLAEDDLTPVPTLVYRPKRLAAEPRSSGSTPPPQIRVLLVEDEIVDAALIESMLSNVEGAEIELVRVNRLAAAVERLASQYFHLVLLDLGLPDSRGLNTFTSLCTRVPDVPVVVFTGNEDEELGIHAVRAGAQDYLVKGTEAATLVRSMRYALGRHRAQTRVRRALAEATSKEANLRQVIEQNFDGILVLGPDQRIVFANTAAARIYGVQPGAVLGMEAGFPIALGQFEIKLLLPEGRRVAVEVRVTPIEWQGCRAHLAQLHDLTERLELHEQRAELEVAREVQRAILPTAPLIIAGIELAGDSLLPEKVGGDYFDLFELPEAVGVAIADASGHGLASAILISETAAYIRAFASVRENLAEVLEATNCQVCRIVPEGTFVTLKLVRINTRTRTLESAGAGHPDGFILDDRGIVRHILRDENPPLGIAFDRRFLPSPPVALNAGDLVVLVTDGATEAFGEDVRMFGRERVLEHVRAVQHLSAHEIAASVCRAAREFSQPLAQRDDITAVVIKVT